MYGKLDSGNLGDSDSAPALAGLPKSRSGRRESGQARNPTGDRAPGQIPLPTTRADRATPRGGARPVPVNFHNLRKPYRDMALVAFAGPLSNFLLAVLFAFIQKMVVEFPDDGTRAWLEFRIWPYDSLGAEVLRHAIFWNLLLAAFNLLPIPPLDGSRIMTWLLPKGLREAYVRLESFGLLLVIVVVWMIPGTTQLILNTVFAMHDLVKEIATLGGLW